MHRSFALVALAASGIFASATVATTAETFTVCDSGCDYTSINAAIDAASDGDIIALSDQLYIEKETINTDGKAISIRGTTDKSGKPTSIITGNDTWRIVLCVSGEGNSTIFENLILQDGLDSVSDPDSGGGGGMYLNGSSPTITNCTFDSNFAQGGGGGMFNDNRSHPIIDNCTFTNNCSEGNGGGILNDRGSSPKISSTIFQNNEATAGGGAISNDHSSDPRITSCSFSANIADLFAGKAIWNQNSSAATITDSSFENHSGSRSAAVSNWYSSHMTLKNCTFDNNQATAVRQYEQSTATIIGCTIDNNGGFGVQSSDNGCSAAITSTRIWCNDSGAVDGDFTDGGGNCINDDCTPCPPHSDDDSDRDGVPDYYDVCPGGDDTQDTDFDGTPDACDECPTDPEKTIAGNCGCGNGETTVAGDLDCDGDYDADDIRLGMLEFGILEGTPGDMDGDGDADEADWALLGEELGICLGDINGDGTVDAADLGLLIAAWGLCP